MSTVDELVGAIYGSTGRFYFLLWIAERKRDQFFLSQYPMETGRRFAGGRSLAVMLCDAGYLKHIEPPSRPLTDDQGRPITLSDGRVIMSHEHAKATWFARETGEMFWLSLLVFAEQWGMTTLPDDAPRSVRAAKPARDLSGVVSELAGIAADLR